MSMTVGVHVGRCYTPIWEILDPPLTLTSFHRLKLTKLPSVHCFVNCRTRWYPRGIQELVSTYELPETLVRGGGYSRPTQTHSAKICPNFHFRGGGDCGKVMFSQTCVILSGGGDLCMMSLPIWWTGPMFLLGALDPGVFHPGGGGSSPKVGAPTYYFGKFPKNCMKKKK